MCEKTITSLYEFLRTNNHSYYTPAASPGQVLFFSRLLILPFIQIYQFAFVKNINEDFYQSLHFLPFFKGCVIVSPCLPINQIGDDIIW